MWNTRGSDIQRRYDYTYDHSGRLSGAAFLQKGSGGWNNNTVDFSVSHLTYDANSNILSVNRNGLKGSQSSTIDKLTYSYGIYSNKLKQVTDLANDPNSTLGDFHYSEPKGSMDYTYDANGNLTSDANKGIDTILYNYLNLPVKITFSPPSGGAGGGYIRFVYDAGGNKLKKMVADYTSDTAKTTTTLYSHGFVYQNIAVGGQPVTTDSLLYLLTGVGKRRPVRDSGQIVGYVNDFFLRDHLGNVRSVVTEQRKEDVYFASMESENAAVENQLFSNVAATAVPKPMGFDNTTDNQWVSALDGSSGEQVGPSIVLKVMAGDTISIGTYAWYQGAVQPPPNTPPDILDNLINALLGSGAVFQSSHGFLNPNNNGASTLVSNDLTEFFSDVNNQYNSSKPKAFINYIAFNNHLQMVSSNSGVVQVPKMIAGDTAQPIVIPQFVVQKSGYIYIYLSNQSAQKVYFDNLTVHHNRGHLLEENQYYPFGLKMAGVSDKALPIVPNHYLYNGKVLNENAFSNGSGLGWYSYGFRDYDPQLGRFIEQDPLKDRFSMVSPYQYGLNDPVANIDWMGLAVLPVFNVFAKGVQRASGFSKFSAQLIKAGSSVGKGITIGKVANVGVNTFKVLAAIGGFKVAEGVGDLVRMKPNDWYKLNNSSFAL